MKSKSTGRVIALSLFFLAAGWFASRDRSGPETSRPADPGRKSVESRPGAEEPAERETGPLPLRPKRPALEKNLSPEEQLQAAEKRLEEDGPEVLAARVHTILPAGNSMVTGGYVTGDGSHEFSVITPKWVEGSGGGRQIQVDVKVLKVDAKGLVSTGLGSLVTSERKSRQNAEVWTPEDVSHTLESSEGVDLMSIPSVVMMPGTSAEIRMGTATDGTYYGFHLEAGEGPDGGFDLKTEIKKIE